MGWRIIPRENGPVALVADDGKQIRVPDNSGIKMDVFRGWVHQIAVHSPGSINRKLIDDIVKTTKLNRDHAHIMYDLVEDAMPDDYGPVDEPEPVQGPQLPRGQEPYILTREPYRNRHGLDTGIAYVRTWSDDSVDYECPRCERVFTTLKGAGAHKQWHIGRGEVPGQQIKHIAGKKARSYDSGFRSKAREPEPVTEKMIEVSEAVMTDAISALKILNQIRNLLGADQVDALTASLDVANARIAQLEGNLKALKDLLGDV
jgi:hypothetical protein